MRSFKRVSLLAGLAAALMVGTIAAQTRIKPGFNLFSIDQDKQVGKQSAAEVEKQLPILNDRAAERYIDEVGQRLAQHAPDNSFDFQFKVVNVSDINAFALPGGYMYVNRGLVEAADSEGELAAVMAHEMSHVILRHGTNQASKAYLGQAGLALFGGFVAKDNASTARTINAVGGFGLNALFLKFSRTDETQADVLGSQIMAKAGYDPQDMVTFFKKLEDKRGREPSKVEQFLSDHPPPGDRAARIKQEAKQLKIRPMAEVGGFQEIKGRLKSLPAAKTTQQVAKSSKSGPGSGRVSEAGASMGDGGAIARPSTQYRAFEQRDGLFTVEYPANWRVYEPANGYGVTIAPDGGLVDTGGPERSLTYGVIINHYDPFYDDESDDRFSEPGAKNFLGGGVGGSSSSRTDRDRTQLAAATNDLLRQVLRTNRNLKIVQDSQRTDTIDGAAALSVVLSGTSSATGGQERVTLFTRELPDDHVLYALFVAPATDYKDLRPTFERILSSLRVNDETRHESQEVH